MSFGSGISLLHRAKKIRDDRSRSKTLQKKRIDNYRNLKNKNGEFNFPEISEEELTKIKTDIRTKGKKQRIIQNSLTVFLTITFFVLLYFLFL